MKIVFNLLFVFVLVINAQSQCNLIIPGDDYEVHIEIDPLTINAPETCPYGYNFTLSANYNIYFTGSNPPSELWTLQGDIDCDNPNLSFDLANGGGTGTLTTANNWRPMTDCASITPGLMNCNNIDIKISGPGIPSQTVSCALGIAVPIELINFTAETKNNEVIVNWQTASETNNDFFTIEKSAHTLDWQIVAERSAADNDDEIKSYQVIDPQPYDGRSFYRLKQTDLDGQFSYSEILSLNIEAPVTQKLNIYPNPVFDKVIIDGFDASPSNIQVYDVLGKDLTSSLEITTGSQEISINMLSLTKGIYMIKAETTMAKIFKL